MSSDGKSHSDRQQTWKVPNLAKCRVVRFGDCDGMVYCLIPDAEHCGFSVHFGASYLCLHPKRAEIAKRSSTKYGRL